MHLDFHLLLRRDAIEATTAGVALDVDDSETVACVLANSLECGQCAGVYFRFKSFRLFAKTLFILLCFRDDFFKFVFLLSENVLLIRKVLFRSSI